MKFSLNNIKSLDKLIDSLTYGLRKLTLVDNFNSFKTTVTIPASSELAIKNELTLIPSGYIIIRKSTDASISDGTSTWTIDTLYLQNHTATEVDITVIFLK